MLTRVIKVWSISKNKFIMKDNRRDFIKKSSSIVAGISLTGVSSCIKTGNKNSKNPRAVENRKIVEWPIRENPKTPKLCMNISVNANEDQMRKIKQMGSDYIVMGGLSIPWKEENLHYIIDRFKQEGLAVICMNIGRIPNTIYGTDERDTEINKIQESLFAASAVGLPVVEYNFLVDRLVESYYYKTGRGGVELKASNYSPVKDLPAKPEIGNYTAEQLWDNLTYFLKAVIPVAEKAGVRMALHPNDPPVPISHGSAQITSTFKDWKRVIELVDSPSNGITFDCGIACEMGEDPLEILRYFGSRDRINHVHYRNVIVHKPSIEYTEVFMDEGQINMFEVMKELTRLEYKYGLYPEHPIILDYDKEHPGYEENKGYIRGYTGQVYNFSFAKAMKLAVLSM